MKTPFRFTFRRIVWATVCCLAGSVFLTAKPLPATTAHSFVNPNYERTKLPNGEWKAENYTFGKGTLIDPSGADDSLTTLTFTEIAKILAESLAEENYLPTPSAKETDLLIVVSWGKTLPSKDSLQGFSIDGMTDILSTVQQIQTDIAVRDGSITDQDVMSGAAERGPSDVEKSQLVSAEGEMTSMMMMQSLSDRVRRQANDHNARLLGYSPALSNAYQDVLPAGVSKSRLEDLIAEIETPRYFVILQAYDFQKMWKEKKKELVWMTRFSIRARGRKFDEQLADMTAAASSLFGKEGGKLKRNLRPGRIKMGEVEVLGLSKDGDEE